MPQKYAPLPLEPRSRVVRLHGQRCTLRELPLVDRLRLERVRGELLQALTAQRPEDALEAVEDLLVIMLGDSAIALAHEIATTWPGCIDALLEAQCRLDLQAEAADDPAEAPKLPGNKTPDEKPRGSEAWEATCVSVGRFFGILPLEVFRTFPARYIARYHLLALREEAQRNLLLVRIAYMQAGADPKKVEAPDWLTDDGEDAGAGRTSSRIAKLKADFAAGKYAAAMEQMRLGIEEFKRTGKPPQGAMVID